MQVLFIVDSITEIKSKIDTLKFRFGDNIKFIVKAQFQSLFSTFGYKANAIYNKNLTRIIQTLVSKSNIESIVLCRASLDFNKELLDKFIASIGNGDKVVNVMPKYNGFERMCNSAYNIYVKSLFKIKDSLSSPKLQYLPALFVEELVNTHFGNKLFELNSKMVKTIYVEDKEVNNSLKVKTKFDKYAIIPIIVALLITIALIVTLAFTKVNYIAILIFICLYVLDLIIAIIYQCKLYFDARFMQ